MMRRGFGLITAIIILVAVATLMSLMVVLSSASLKHTTDIYLKEQAELLARSAVEYTLLAISGHDNNNSCIENVNISYPNSATPTHEANVTVYYFFKGAPANCNHVLVNNIATKESNLTALIDVKVSVDMNNTGITEPIVIHRRTIQKP
jgi:hypothetical protein